MSVNNVKLTYKDWINKYHNNLLNLFCKFIKKEKVYDCDLATFSSYMYETDYSCKDYNKGRNIK